MEKNKKIALGELISELKSVLIQGGENSLTDNEDWFYYTEESAVLDLNTIGIIADPVEVDEEEWEEILPDIAVENDFLNPISSELIDNVLINAFSQNAKVSNDKIIEALNYYIENDSFMAL